MSHFRTSTTLHTGSTHSPKVISLDKLFQSMVENGSAKNPWCPENSCQNLSHWGGKHPPSHDGSMGRTVYLPLFTYMNGWFCMVNVGRYIILWAFDWRWLDDEESMLIYDAILVRASPKKEVSHFACYLACYAKGRSHRPFTSLSPGSEV